MTQKFVREEDNNLILVTKIKWFEGRNILKALDPMENYNVTSLYFTNSSNFDYQFKIPISIGSIIGLNSSLSYTNETSIFLNVSQILSVRDCKRIKYLCIYIFPSSFETFIELNEENNKFCQSTATFIECKPGKKILFFWTILPKYFYF